MAYNQNQQIIKLISQSKNILVCFKKDWTGDALASSLVLKKSLEKISKQVDVVCDDFKTKDALSFLPQTEVKTHFQNLNKFIIKINTLKTKVGEFDYNHEDDSLNIYLTPQNGKFTAEDVSTAASDYKYDLIIILNSPDLDSLGQLWEDNQDFFFTTPKINIDHSDKNEHFGDINFVNLASSSTTELVYEIIKELEESIDEDIATYILAGIILATKNFKIQNIAPQTLSLASELVDRGGRREQIIKSLYQNRFLKTLKLWGRVLSRLKSDDNGKLVWSVVSKDDFLETSTTPEEVEDVIEELITTMPETEVICLIYENHNQIDCVVYSVKNTDSLMLCKEFDPRGNKELARFSINNISLPETENLIIGKIQSKLGL